MYWVLFCHFYKLTDIDIFYKHGGISCHVVVFAAIVYIIFYIEINLHNNMISKCFSKLLHVWTTRLDFSWVTRVHIRRLNRIETEIHQNKFSVDCFIGCHIFSNKKVNVGVPKITKNPSEEIWFKLENQMSKTRWRTCPKMYLINNKQ